MKNTFVQYFFTTFYFYFGKQTCPADGGAYLS